MMQYIHLNPRHHTLITEYIDHDPCNALGREYHTLLSRQSTVQGHASIFYFHHNLHPGYPLAILDEAHDGIV